MTRLFYLFLLCNAVTASPYCTTDTSVNPGPLPPLPVDFQTKFQAVSQIDSTTAIYDGYIVFDTKTPLAIFTYQSKSSHNRYVMDYKNNKFYSYTDNQKCNFKPLNESADEILFFGLKDLPGQGGFQMKPSSEFFHFNNGFQIVKMGDSNWRGINVTHYRSCQNWTEMDVDYQADFYFTKPEIKIPISLNSQPGGTLIGMMIQGVIVSSNKPFNNSYHFYDLEWFANKQKYSQHIPGVNCVGEPTGAALPEIPDIFTYTQEVINYESNTIYTAKTSYYGFAKSIRIDHLVPENSRVIADFISGVSYVIDPEDESCMMVPISKHNKDVITWANKVGYSYELKKPKELFYIDDSYSYIGEKMERSVVCDVYASYRPNITGPDPVMFEIYFKKSLDNERAQVPLAIKVFSSPNTPILAINIYDFHVPSAPQKSFDISSCYKTSKETIDFAMFFDYPDKLNKTLFDQLDFDLMETLFLTPVVQSLHVFTFSSLRVKNPTIISHDTGFTIYSSIVNNPKPIDQYTKSDEKVRVIVDGRNKHTRVAIDAESCAVACYYLTDLEDKKSCISYDVCPDPSNANTVKCSFYTTGDTDPSLILNTQPECDHFTKNVLDTDNLLKEDIFWALEFAVSRKLFKLKIADGENFYQFLAKDIAKASLSAVPSSTDFDSTKLPFVMGLEAELNINAVPADQLSSTIRQRRGISLRECFRFCMIELAFRCESVSYSEVKRECTWSSIEGSNLDTNPALITITQDTDLYFKNPLVNYVEIPGHVLSAISMDQIQVNSASQCANKCTYSAKLDCKSFSLCESSQDSRFKFNCLLNTEHNELTSYNATLISSPICTYYSKKAVNDFKLVPQSRLSTTPKSQLLNVSVDLCSLECTYMEGFVCRSFDYFITNSTCWFYSENVKDGVHLDLKLIKDASCNHYSREYLVQNGEIIPVETVNNIISKGPSDGTIAGVVIGVFILSLLLGAVTSFGYKKYSVKKSDIIVSMRNPIEFSSRDQSD